MELPVVDSTGLLQRDAEASTRAAAAIRDAYIEYGFLYVSGHGVPQPTIDAAGASAMRFFRLPEVEKRQVSANIANRGWHALGDALMYGAEKPDYKEFYQVGLELPSDDPDVLAGQPLRGANNWPRFMPELQRDMYAYFEAVAVCGQALSHGVALSLDIDPDFFVDKYFKPLQRTQAVYYPPQPASLSDDQFGVAAHTDFGNITILWQDDNGGLEVQNLAGEWIAAPPVPDTMVVNAGDLLGRWSNDRYRSTKHRVVNRSGRERISIATFYDPTFTAKVDPRDLGLPSEQESKYLPISAGEHILERIDASFGYRKSLR